MIVRCVGGTLHNQFVKLPDDSPGLEAPVIDKWPIWNGIQLNRYRVDSYRVRWFETCYGSRFCEAWLVGLDPTAGFQMPYGPDVSRTPAEWTDAMQVLAVVYIVRIEVLGRGHLPPSKRAAPSCIHGEL